MQQDDSDVAKWSHSDDVVDQKQIAVWGDNEPSSHSKTMCAVSHKDNGLKLKFCAHKLPFLCKYRACLEGKSFLFLAQLSVIRPDFFKR